MESVFILFLFKWLHDIHYMYACLTQDFSPLALGTFCAGQFLVVDVVLCGVECLAAPLTLTH